MPQGAMNVGIVGAVALVAVIGYLYCFKYKRIEVQDVKNEPNLKQCRVYYGSQTGTAERFARELASTLSKFGKFFHPETVNLEDFNRDDFLSGGMVAIFLVATHDEGLFTDNALGFVKWLRELKRKNVQLRSLNFSIFGLGSSEYDESFNMAAKNLSSILTGLGAKSLTETVYGDEAIDLRGDFSAWKSKLFLSLSNLYGIDIHNTQVTEKRPLVKPSDSWRNLAKLELCFVNSPFKEEIKVMDIICKQQSQCKDHIVLKNTNLTPQSESQTNHIVLSVNEPFQVAETAYVLYRNPPESVEYFMRRLNLGESDMRKLITFVPRYQNESKDQFSAPFPIPSSIEDALVYYCDLTTLPSLDVLYDLGSFLKDPRDCDCFNRLLSNGPLLKRMREELFVTLCEFVEIFMKSAQFNLAGFLQLIPKKVPKPYTISSYYPEEKTMSLTVKLVQCSLYSFKSFYKELQKRELVNKLTDPEIFKKRRFYKGACTHYLCSLETGQVVKIFKRSSAFSSIRSFDVPIAMISNGAGIAPFRSFWQNKANKQRILLLGFKTSNDVLYAHELQELKDTENFIVEFAFSRQDKMIRVQELVRKYSPTLKEVIESNGIICLCGSKGMGAGVKSILEHTLQTKISELKLRNQFIEELW